MTRCCSPPLRNNTKVSDCHGVVVIARIADACGPARHDRLLPQESRNGPAQAYARHHVRKILALAEIYPVDAVARAISDGLAFQAFSAEYITNILEARARALPEPAPLQLTRRHDLLDIDIAPPDLNAYEVNDHDSE